MRVLIIHHLEPIWESGYRKYKESFHSLAYRFIEHLEEVEYDRVILTQFEDCDARPEHIEAGIANLVDQWEEYSYGWNASCLDDNSLIGIDFCEGGSHSELVLLDQWIRDLKGNDVYISGAFDGECIEDLEIALGFLEIPFKRVESLIL